VACVNGNAMTIRIFYAEEIVSINLFVRLRFVLKIDLMKDTMRYLSKASILFVPLAHPME
jgi:hypothetical protein